MDRKRALALLIRIGISVGLFVFLFWQMPDVDVSEMVPEWKTSTLVWLVLAFLLTVAAFVMSAVRWQQVARAIGLRVGLGRLLSHYMAGQFLSNFVPTTVGGDVLRVARLSKDTEDAPRSFTSVVFERLSGWIVLPAISLSGLALNSDLRDLAGATRAAFATAGVVLFALVGLILLAGNDFTGRMLERREGTIGRWFNSIHLGLDALRASPGSVWRILAAGFAYQLVLLAAIACAVEAIGIEEVGFTALLAFIPAVLIVQVLPLGIGGLGVREGALVFFFSRLGVQDEQSIALGLLLYLLTVAASLLGFPALIFGGTRGDEDDAEAVPVAA